MKIAAEMMIRFFVLFTRKFRAGFSLRRLNVHDNILFSDDMSKFL